MFPKKIVFFGVLVFAGLAYLLKDKSLSQLQSGETRKYEERKIENKKLREDPNYKEKEAKAKAQERGFKFLPKECYTNNKKGWEFVKILAAESGSYKVVFCHKYKGCTEQQSIPFMDLEYEFKRATKIKCSR